MKEIHLEIGEFIIEFGNVEALIRTAIIGIPNSIEKNHENEFIKLIRNVVLDTALHINLKTLKETIEIFASEENKKNWFNLIDKVKIISEYRNLLVHGGWYYNNARQIFKTKKFNWDNEVIIDLVLIKSYTEELKNIYRQILDFLEYTISLTQENFEYFDDFTPKNFLRIN